MGKSFLEVKFLEENILYDGSQLAPHWIYKTTNIMGDAVVAFTGPCDVGPDYMVDLQDIKTGDFIKSSNMLHFIVELFDKGPFVASAIQSVFMSEIQGALIDKRIPVTKEGDDLYIGRGKLSVSIATVSPVSALTRFPAELITTGTPFKT